MSDHNYFADLVRQVADLRQGPYRPPQYERVMPSMTIPGPWSEISSAKVDGHLQKIGVAW